VEGFLLGLRSLADPQGPFEAASLRATFENQNTKSLTDSTSYGRAFMYGGRSRLAEYASSFLAESLRTRRAFAAYPQLSALRSRLGLANQNKALSDELCALISATLRLATRPTVTAGASTSLVPLASVKTGGKEAWPLFLVGRAGRGGVLTLCTVDYALEQEVFKHTFAAAAAGFQDWVFSAGQVDSDSGTQLLHVESLGATEDGALFRFEPYTVDDGSIPIVPKARVASSFAQSEVEVSAEVLSRFGKPGLPLRLTLKHGVLAVPRRVGDKIVAPGGEAIVRIHLKDPHSNEVFEVFLPVAFMSPDTQFSLQTNPGLSSTIIVYSEMIQDALSPAAPSEGQRLSRTPDVVNAQGDRQYAAIRNAPTPLVNGIGLGIRDRKGKENYVISCRLELPLRLESLTTENGKTTRVEVAATWIEQRIREVFVVSTSRGWLIVASLCAALTLIFRSRAQGWRRPTKAL
jgi:hypothetical protein